jgi:DNA polymerase III delta prime subunit
MTDKMIKSERILTNDLVQAVYAEHLASRPTQSDDLPVFLSDLSVDGKYMGAKQEFRFNEFDSASKTNTNVHYRQFVLEKFNETNPECWIVDNCPGFLYRTMGVAKTSGMVTQLGVSSAKPTENLCKHVKALIPDAAKAFAAIFPDQFPSFDMSSPMNKPITFHLVEASDEFFDLSNEERAKSLVSEISGEVVQEKKSKEKKPKVVAEVKVAGNTVMLERLKKVYDYCFNFLTGKGNLAATQVNAMLFEGPAGTGKTQIANELVHDMLNTGAAHVEELVGVSIDPNKYAEYLLGADTLKDATVVFEPGLLLTGAQKALTEGKNKFVVLIHEFNRSTGLVHLDAILRSIGDSGYIQFNSQAENVKEITDKLAPLKVDHVSGTLYRVNLKDIGLDVRFLMTGNIGTEYQVQQIPLALRGRISFMHFPYYTPTEIKEIFEKSPAFKAMGKSNRDKTVALYQMFWNYYNNKEIMSIPRITEILSLIDFSNIDVSLAIQNMKAQISDEYGDGQNEFFKNMTLLLQDTGEEAREENTEQR